MSYVEQYAPRRVPKLAVRNRWPVDAAVPGQSTQRSTQNAFTDGTLPTSSSAPTSPDLAGPPRAIRHSTSGYQLGGSSCDSEHNFTANRTTKKGGKGMLNFLTLKEPSTSAWADYAAQQKKAAARKSTLGMPVTVSGVSHQKLPEHVPRVNSKWDGLPDSTRVAQSPVTSHRQSWYQSQSESLTSSQRRSDEPQSLRARHSGVLQGTLSSKPSTISSYSSSSSSSANTRSSARTTQRVKAPVLPNPRRPADIHPAFRVPTTPDLSQGTVAQLSTTSNTSSRSRATADLGIHDLPYLVNNDSSSVVNTSNEGSPLTPPIELHSPCIPLSLTDKPDTAHSVGSAGDRRSVTLRSREDPYTHVSHVTTSPSPVAVNFSRPLAVVTQAGKPDEFRGTGVRKTATSAHRTLPGVGDVRDVLPWEVIEPPADTAGKAPEPRLGRSPSARRSSASHKSVSKRFSMMRLAGKK